MGQPETFEARVAMHPGVAVEHHPAVILGENKPLRLASGAELGPFTVA